MKWFLASLFAVLASAIVWISAPILSQTITVPIQVNVVPAITFSLPTLSFPAGPISVPSAPLIDTATNIGTVPVAFSISIAGTNSGDFSESDNCGGSLVPGANCQISVIFTPSATGSRSASIVLTGTATPIINFLQPTPILQDTAALGTPITQIAATMSDGSAFTGTLGFGSPYSNDAGICRISGTTNLVLGAPLPPGNSIQHCTITATATSGTGHQYQIAALGASTSPPPPGSVPPPADAAGFTNQIINDDFGTMGVPSNWLDCAGAGSPLWWFGWVGFGTVDGHCFDITQATDPLTGQPAARIHFQDSYWTNTQGVAAGTMMETTNSSGVGRRIPPGFYSEIVARTDVLTSNTGGSMDLWGLTPTPGDYEIDGLEEFGPVSTISSNIHNAPTGFNNCARCASCPTAAVGGCGFDLTQYHTYAMRQTSGGTDRIFCAYTDGALQGCQTIQPNAQQLAGLPMVLQMGSYKSGGTAPIGGSGKNVWVKSVKVWTCPAGGINSGVQCNSSSNNP